MRTTHAHTEAANMELEAVDHADDNASDDSIRRKQLLLQRLELSDLSAEEAYPDGVLEDHSEFYEVTLDPDDPALEQAYCALHPRRLCLCMRRHYRLSRTRFSQLIMVLGRRFLAMLIMVEWVLQAGVAGGGASGLIGAPIILMLSEYGLTPSRMQILEAIVVSAWCLKPISALFMEAIYIGGYNKIPYIMITSLGAFMACVLIASFYPFASPLTLVALLFPLFLQIATADLLIESKYVQKLRRYPDLRPKLVAFVQTGQGVIQLLAIGLLGLLLYVALPLQYLYLLPAPIFLLILYPAYENWIEDTERQPQARHELRVVTASGGSTLVHNCATNERTTYQYELSPDELQASRGPLENMLGCLCVYRNKSAGDGGEYVITPDEVADPSTQQWGEAERMPVFGFDRAKITRNWRMFLLSFYIGVLAVLANVLGVLGCSSTVLFTFSLLGALSMIVAFFMLMDADLARVMTYVILQNMFSVSLRAATYRFYTDDAHAYPEGPHFSREFYITVMGAVGIALGIGGTILYDSFMAHWRYRTIFWVTGLVYIFVSLSNFVLFKRLNVGYIPDTVFVLGSEVVQVVVGTWNNMPYSIMVLGLCKPGLETLSYAIYAGVLNLGSAFSAFQGAFLLDAMHINPTGNSSGESAQFDNLWIASLIATGIQIVPIVVTNVLIPDSRQTDDLLAIEKREKQQTQQDDGA